jgi:hypothetical protein
MRSLNFASIPPPLGGRSGASSDPRWARRLIENFAQEGGLGGLPLDSLPLWGREGVTLTTTTEEFQTTHNLRISTEPNHGKDTCL